MSRAQDAGDAPMVLGDWGTTRLRLFLSAAGRTLERLDGPGIGSRDMSPAQTLHLALAPWIAKYDPQRIVLCGMAGSREGLIEVPYAPCPIDALHWARAAVKGADGPLPITMAAGISCEHPDGTPDVMRGEETQIFGAISLHRELGHANRFVILPGTHGKWARLIDGKIVGFHTFITGEMFALLRDHSSLARPGGDDAGSDEQTQNGDAFLIGLQAAAAKPAFASLFEVRTAQLRAGRSRRWALDFLSGLLIGHEVGEALAFLGPPGRISLIGAPLLTDRYRVALARQGISSVEIDGDVCALAGLRLLAAESAVTLRC